MLKNKSQLSTVRRYIDKNNGVQEIFLGFTDVSQDRSTLALFKHVNKILKEYKCEKKLVTTTYGDAAVMARVEQTGPRSLSICYVCSQSFTEHFNNLLPI